MLEATWQRIPFAEAAEETVGIFATEIPPCGCRRSLPLEMETGHTWETERPLMRGKKVLSHCCFSWSSDSRIVPGKFGCCFCYLYSEPTGTEYIVYSGLELRDPWGWVMHHRHCADSSFHRSEKGSERKAGGVSTDINCLPPSSAGSTQCDHSIFAQFLHFLLGSYTEHNDAENC